MVYLKKKFTSDSLALLISNRKKIITKTDKHIVHFDKEHKDNSHALQRSNYLRIDNDMHTFVDQENAVDLRIQFNFVKPK